jgi:hypothetical protein
MVTLITLIFVVVDLHASQSKGYALYGHDAHQGRIAPAPSATLQPWCCSGRSTRLPSSEADTAGSTDKVPGIAHPYERSASRQRTAVAPQPTMRGCARRRDIVRILAADARELHVERDPVRQVLGREAGEVGLVTLRTHPRG